MTGERGNYLSALDYGNGDRVQYTYDDKGRVTQQTYEDGATVSYKYDNSGALATVTDSATGRTTTYYYDAIDRLMKYVESGENYSHSVAYTYDNINNLTAQVETINGVETTTGYTYDDDNRVTVVESGGTEKVYTYDNLGRVSTETVKQGTGTILTKTYTFEEPTSDTTSNRVSSVDTYFATSGGRTGYSYDDNGNIVSINDGGGNSLQSYIYDAQNQLVRENNYVGGYTHTWTYDTAGNIQTRKEYAYTTGELGNPTRTVTYNYGDTEWKDLLTSYDGKTINYDQIGNPLSDGTWNYTWQNGRQLTSMSDGTTTWTYTYDANGMRTSRTNGTDTYTYVYNGSQLVKMTKNDDVLTFTYDANGAPMTVTWNGTTYYYVTNLQGDVERILDEYGTRVAWYLYDAWGELRSAVNMQGVDLAQLNPLRYRGYVYDAEYSYYYLQSRYYNPENGRFINADGQLPAGNAVGINLFAYCGNNPINRFDPTGEAWWHWAIGAAIVVACAAATVVTCGGFAAAAGAVAAVGSGVAAATTASTVAAAAFIGSATAYGTAVLAAASSSNSIKEFNDQGSWDTVASTAYGGFRGGYDGYTMSKAQSPASTSTNPQKTSPKNTNVSRGSSGRTEPSNLREKLAMEQVKSNPSAGTPLTRITMNDPRWPSSEGWIKMQQIVPTSQGNINIHYVYNQNLQIYDDFKFKP